MEDMFFHNIDKYVYDECTKEEMNLFLEHIESCAQCKEEYELSCSLRDAMRSMPDTPPPADFSKLVNDRLDKELAAPKKISFLSAGYRKYSAVAACLILAVALGVENSQMTEQAPLESTTVSTTPGLQFMPDTTEAQAEIPQPEDAAPQASAAQASARPASTKKPAPALPAATEKPVQQSAEITEPVYSAENNSWILPEHLDPSKTTVLASSVEKKYQISGIDPEDMPVPERDLAKEFALLEKTKSGVIIANTANISSLDGIQIETTDEPDDTAGYGVGSGSIHVSSKDKVVVDELLIKYISMESGGCCFFTGEDFDSFIHELDSRGVPYKENLMTERGNNVAIKVIIG